RWRRTGSPSFFSQRCTVRTSRFKYAATSFHESRRSARSSVTGGEAFWSEVLIFEPLGNHLGLLWLRSLPRFTSLGKARQTTAFTRVRPYRLRPFSRCPNVGPSAQPARIHKEEPCDTRCASSSGQPCWPHLRAAP